MSSSSHRSCPGKQADSQLLNGGPSPLITQLSALDLLPAPGLSPLASAQLYPAPHTSTPLLSFPSISSGRCVCQVFPLAYVLLTQSLPNALATSITTVLILCPSNVSHTEGSIPSPSHPVRLKGVVQTREQKPVVRDLGALVACKALCGKPAGRASLSIVQAPQRHGRTVCCCRPASCVARSWQGQRDPHCREAPPSSVLSREWSGKGLRTAVLPSPASAKRPLQLLFPIATQSLSLALLRGLSFQGSPSLSISWGMRPGFGL